MEHQSLRNLAGSTVLTFRNRKGTLETLVKRRRAEITLAGSLSYVVGVSFTRARAHIREALGKVYGPEPLPAPRRARSEHQRRPSPAGPYKEDPREPLRK